MTRPNTDPASPPERDSFQNQVMIEYNDGEVDIQFKTPGDELILGLDSPFKHAQYLGVDQPNMAAVRTKSGNVYLVADGLVFNYGTRRAYRQPDELPAVKIGEQWVVPGVGTTSDVKDVLLRWKTAPGFGDVVVDAPGPFATAKQQLKRIRAQNPNL